MNVELTSRTARITIAQPAAGLVRVTFAGHDVGDVGDAPFRALDRILAETAGPLELFIDARSGKTASLDVSGAWARWLGSRRVRLAQVTMLTGSPFIRLSADFVRRFADLDDLMRVTTDAHAFDAALVDAIRAADRSRC